MKLETGSFGEEGTEVRKLLTSIGIRQLLFNDKIKDKVREIALAEGLSQNYSEMYDILRWAGPIEVREIMSRTLREKSPLIDKIREMALGFSKGHDEMLDILRCLDNLYDVVANRSYQHIISNCVRNRINLNKVEDKNCQNIFLEREDTHLAKFRGGSCSFKLPEYRPWTIPCFYPEIEAESTWRERCKRAKELWKEGDEKRYDQLKTLIFTLLEYKKNYRGFSLEDELISFTSFMPREETCLLEGITIDQGGLVIRKSAGSFSDYRKRYPQDWPLRFITYDGVMTDKALTPSHQMLGSVILYENDESYKRGIHKDSPYYNYDDYVPERESRHYFLYAKVVPKS